MERTCWFLNYTSSFKFGQTKRSSTPMTINRITEVFARRKCNLTNTTNIAAAKDCPCFKQTVRNVVQKPYNARQAAVKKKKSIKPVPLKKNHEYIFKNKHSVFMYECYVNSYL